MQPLQKSIPFFLTRALNFRSVTQKRWVVFLGFDATYFKKGKIFGEKFQNRASTDDGKTEVVPPQKKLLSSSCKKINPIMLRDATNIPRREASSSSSPSSSPPSLTFEGTRRGGKVFEDAFREEIGKRSENKEERRRTLEEEEEEEDLARDYTIELLSDEFVSEFLFDPSAFDSMRAESERCCGVALDALYPTSLRQMSRDELLREKSNLKKRLRAYDARLMKVNNIVASKADKKHARPLYARLARVKQQIELLEIRDGLEVLPNLKLAAIGTAH